MILFSGFSGITQVTALLPVGGLHLGRRSDPNDPSSIGSHAHMRPFNASPSRAVVVLVEDVSFEQSSNETRVSTRKAHKIGSLCLIRVLEPVGNVVFCGT